MVDAATVLSTHLTELLKSNMSDLLSYGEVQKLLKDLPKEQGELVKDIVPAQITVSGIQRVLQMLLAERISIRDLVDHPRRHRRRARRSRAIRRRMVEHVRARLARQICAQNTAAGGYLPLIALSAKWEQAFAESIDRPGRRPPARDAAVASCRSSSPLVRERFEQAAREGEAPVLVTSAAIRPFVRSHRRALPRADHRCCRRREIHPRARLRTLGSI